MYAQLAPARRWGASPVEGGVKAVEKRRIEIRVTLSA